MIANLDGQEIILMFVLKSTLYIKKEPIRKKINVQAIHLNEENKKKYQDLVEENLLICKKPTNIQERWNNIVKSTREAAVTTVGYKTSKQSNSKTVLDLSIKQKKLLMEINAETYKNEKRKLKKERNKVLNQIQKAIKEEKNNKLAEIMKPIENKTNPHDQMFEAIKQLKRMKPKKNLIIKTENGFTANPSKQIQLIGEYFQKQFFKNAEQPSQIEPEPMQEPFTGIETKKAAFKSKNNTSPGIDETHIEMVKYGPMIVFEEIAVIFNEIAATGEYPVELIQGMISPLQKPAKQKGPIPNLRPITLLSVLRKLLATCLCERTNERIDEHIPIQQAA